MNRATSHAISHDPSPDPSLAPVHTPGQGPGQGPGQAVSRATDLLKLLNRLIEVLGREIAHLRAMKPAEMQALQQDKIVLTAAYESMVTEIRANPGLLADLDPLLKEQVIQAAGRFQEVLGENARALYAVKEANDKLFRAVVRAIEEKRNEARAYAPSGSFAPHTRLSAGEAVSLAVDQRL